MNPFEPMKTMIMSRMEEFFLPREQQLRDVLTGGGEAISANFLSKDRNEPMVPLCFEFEKCLANVLVK